MVDAGLIEESESGTKLPVLQTATALAVSFVICKSAIILTSYFGIQGGSLPAITAIVVILATVFPNQFAYLAPSGEAMALILMQVSNHKSTSPCIISCFPLWRSNANLVVEILCFYSFLFQSHMSHLYPLCWMFKLFFALFWLGSGLNLEFSFLYILR